MTDEGGNDTTEAALISNGGIHRHVNNMLKKSLLSMGGRDMRTNERAWNAVSAFKAVTDMLLNPRV